MKAWFVYIMTNHTNTVLYTGITNDLERRVAEHKTGLSSSSFTKRYQLYKIIWHQEFSSPQGAIAVEKKIKGWTRAKKIALIRQINPLFQNLAALR